MGVRFSSALLILLFITVPAAPGAAKKGPSPPGTAKGASKQAASWTIARDPYIGAIVVDAASGQVLFSDHADERGYPASVVKLMDLLITLERVRQGTLKLSDMVTVTAEAAGTGGSQVYLKEKERFSIDDLLYALMIKSANDAAAALAIHLAGSTQAFVELMNRKAQELGMTSTRFHTVHGLPPSRGKTPDETTARDLSILARAVLQDGNVLRYSSRKHYPFRNGTFSLNTHNYLLSSVEGCDGLKTGYFAKAGFSIVATALRNNIRVIAVVLGSRSQKKRDSEARELIAKGFLAAPRRAQVRY